MQEGEPPPPSEGATKRAMGGTEGYGALIRNKGGNRSYDNMRKALGSDYAGLH